MTSEKERKIRVVVIDNSATRRQVLKFIAASHPAVTVIGTASDPFIGRDKIKQLKPDVILLNEEVAHMEGFTFLRNMIRFRPTPIIVISSPAGGATAIPVKPRDLGVMDCVTLPSDELTKSPACRRALIDKIRDAAARSHALPLFPQGMSASSRNSAALWQSAGPGHEHGLAQVIAIGASTGGTEAIREILQHLPTDMAPILIAQHIPGDLSASFVDYLNRHSPLTVREAGDGLVLQRGHAYIAPANRHLLLGRESARYVCRLSDLPPVRRHRPSVDLLFESLAVNAGAEGTGVILTGMGDDGSSGLRGLYEAGGVTIAQDEESSVVWGMPAEAVRNGAALQVMPLSKIKERLIELAANAAQPPCSAGGGVPRH